MANPVKILCNTTSYNYSEYPDTIQLIKNATRKRLSEEEVLGLIKQHDPVGIIAGIEPITERILQAAKSLKAISRCGIDTETIDQKAARKIGVSVLRSHHAPDVPVAELTVTMILSLLRKISGSAR